MLAGGVLTFKLCDFTRVIIYCFVKSRANRPVRESSMQARINLGSGDFTPEVQKLLGKIAPNSSLMSKIGALRVAQVQRKLRNRGDSEFPFRPLWPMKENRDKAPLLGKVFQNTFSFIVEGLKIIVGSNFFQGKLLHEGGRIKPVRAKMLFIPLKRSVNRGGTTYKVEAIRNKEDRYYWGQTKGRKPVKKLKFRKGIDFLFLKAATIPSRLFLNFSKDDVDEIANLVVAEMAGSES